MAGEWRLTMMQRLWFWVLAFASKRITPTRRCTIAELEALLAQGCEGADIIVLPNGEVRAL